LVWIGKWHYSPEPLVKVEEGAAQNVTETLVPLQGGGKLLEVLLNLCARRAKERENRIETVCPLIFRNPLKKPLQLSRPCKKKHSVRHPSTNPRSRLVQAGDKKGNSLLRSCWS